MDKYTVEVVYTAIILIGCICIVCRIKHGSFIVLLMIMTGVGTLCGLMSTGWLFK